jgi:anti-sigma regulatory factor (Ser/Thr protein kinase)
MNGATTFAWRPARGGPTSARIPMGDLSRVGEARRAADTIARSCGLDEQARGTLGIVVTEAATNLARHAREGVILLRDTTPAGPTGVEVLAIDRGPGMQDLSRTFADGFSTGGTRGEGLGAIKRQANELDVYSIPGQGTVLVARVYASDEGAHTPRMLDTGVVCVPIDGEETCGDGWSVRQDDDSASVMLVDGLGHGPNAAEAADTAAGVFRASAGRSPKETVGLIHEALRATRGAAVAVAEIHRDASGATVRLCGVGNTVSALVGAGPARALPSMNGTAGLSVPVLQEFTQPWGAADLLVMHTDGITTRWRLDAYPELRAHDPGIVAGVIHRDFTRGRDDATVIALRLRDRGGA